MEAAEMRQADEQYRFQTQGEFWRRQQQVAAIGRMVPRETRCKSPAAAAPAPPHDACARRARLCRMVVGRLRPL